MLSLTLLLCALIVVQIVALAPLADVLTRALEAADATAGGTLGGLAQPAR